ncbi:MAG TPA: O-antigen ligase family protein [Candidatus Mediterraneibacter intestinavium]|nr:O-antigen ligase family protein [Candidatus Mediterraneibacter intestinavium]
MEKVKQNYEEIIEVIFKVCYLLLTLATFITVIYASPVQPLLVKASLVLGMVLILIRVVKIRKYAKMPCVILMVLFCVSFLLTTVMNRQYGITENGKWVIWTGIQFFALYVCDVERSEEKYRREFRILSHILIVCSSIAALASIVQLVQVYSQYITTADGEFIVTGYTWGRLWGVYTDPNYGAVISVISITLSLLFFLQKKGLIRIAYIVSIILNFVYFVYSDSRTGEIAIVVSVGLFLILWFSKKKASAKKIVRFGVPVILIVCIAAAGFGGMQAMKSQYGKYYAAVSAERAKNRPKQEVKKDNSTAGRKQDIQQDVSNGRFALWQSAVEVWETSPVYGAGYSTFVPYAQEHTPDTYAVNNDQGNYTSMHNTFFNALAFQGTIGAVLFVLIALRILTYVLIPVLKDQSDGSAELAAMLACTGAVVVSMMFLLEGIYTNSPGSFVLWTFTGYMVRFAYRKRREGSK